MEIKRYEYLYQFEKEHWWYYGRRKLLIHLVKSLNINKNQKLLDIGCGCGYNLLTLNKIIDASGVDIEQESILYCQKRGLENVQKVNKEKLPFKKNTFDIITCLDVLEHIENDKKYLAEIKRLLKKDGILILFVPVYPILWSKLDTKSHHIRRYKKNLLLEKITSAGYKIEKENFFNFLFFLPILMIRLYQNLPFSKKNNWGHDPIINSHIINNLLKIIFTFDALSSLYIRKPFGVSMFVIAKKI